MQIALSVEKHPECIHMAYVTCDGVRVDTAIAADEAAGWVDYIDLSRLSSYDSGQDRMLGAIVFVPCHPFSRADLERLVAESS